MTLSTSGGRHSPKWRKALLRILLWGACLLAASLLVMAALNVRMVALAREAIYIPANAQSLRGDCILVLGCGVRRDGAPSQMLADRLDVGIAAYHQGVAPKLLMSGDHGRDTYDEVNAMKDYAIARGVPSEDIFMDHAGFSTYESMYRAREIFRCVRVVVVTQTYHLYRAIHNARAMGLEAVGISSNLRMYARQRHFDLREFAARAKDTLWCLFKPAPTYMGEVIPIFGNGDATNDK